MSIEVVATIKEHFGQVRDPRQPGKVEHPLINIIFITICGVLCGADNWVAIEAFGNGQKEWLSICPKITLHIYSQSEGKIRRGRIM